MTDSSFVIQIGLQVAGTVDPEEQRSNFTRLCQLLVEKGVDALRCAFDMLYSTYFTQQTLLCENSALKEEIHNVIESFQGEVLYSAPGIPDSKEFDIILLTILLHKLDTAVPRSRKSCLDDEQRAYTKGIWLCGYLVYRSIKIPQYDDIKFNKLWDIISKILKQLSVTEKEINELKLVPVTAEKGIYVEKLQEWVKSTTCVWLNDLFFVSEDLALVELQSLADCKVSRKLNHV